MEKYTETQIENAMNRVKSKVFLDSNGGFLGSIMCNMEFNWNKEIPTAQVMPGKIEFNPDWFMEIPEQTRIFVILHELWHVAYLHFVREGDRDHLYWNYACDISINNRLSRDGYTYDGTDPWIDLNFPEEIPSEEIYNIIYKQQRKPKQSAWGAPSNGGKSGDKDSPIEGDLGKATKEEQLKAVNTVVSAVHNANMHSAGNVPQEIIDTVTQFLRPQLKWGTIVRNWLTDMQTSYTSWRRPNRRYTDMYMPSRIKDEGRLQHLIYYQDASSSISEKEKQVFNSELKFIWDNFEPVKMTIVIFNTRITEEIVFNEGDTFKEISIKGRGGTSLVEVREHIMKHQPTAAVIFSDLWVTPMEEGPKVPIIWVAINNPTTKVPFGKLLHLKC